MQKSGEYLWKLPCNKVVYLALIVLEVMSSRTTK